MLSVSSSYLARQVCPRHAPLLLFGFSRQVKHEPSWQPDHTNLIFSIGCELVTFICSHLLLAAGTLRSATCWFKCSARLCAGRTDGFDSVRCHQCFWATHLQCCSDDMILSSCAVYLYILLASDFNNTLKTTCGSDFYISLASTLNLEARKLNTLEGSHQLKSID